MLRPELESGEKLLWLRASSSNQVFARAGGSIARNVPANVPAFQRPRRPVLAAHPLKSVPLFTVLLIPVNQPDLQGLLVSLLEVLTAPKPCLAEKESLTDYS